MRILVAGDSHGDGRYVQYLVESADDNGCELIIQLGDFGLWPGKFGEQFLADADVALAEANLDLWWLDGNHEDHGQIQAWSTEPNFYEQPKRVTDRISYLPRGYRFELGGLHFLALGGAWSIDKDFRTAHVDWWPQEELTEADVRRATQDSAPIDVLLSHDMPALDEAYAHFPWMAEGGSQNRSYVQHVASALDARLHLHGHMHRAYAARADRQVIVGFDCNFKPARSIGVLDTDRALISTQFSGSMSFIPHDRGH